MPCRRNSMTASGKEVQITRTKIVQTELHQCSVQQTCQLLKARSHRERQGHDASYRAGRRQDQGQGASERQRDQQTLHADERGNRRRHDEQLDRSASRDRPSRARNDPSFSRDASGPATSPQQPAKDPADLVRSMMGVPGGGPMMTADAKKKLLWGKKADASAGQPAPTYGANSWHKAEFGSDMAKEKFQKMMGVRPPAPTVPQEHETQSAAMFEDQEDPDSRARAALSKDKQQEMLDNMEQEYARGVRRNFARGVGLGL
ncbi:hypothetical protein WJX84_000308 [Apatococcus fuscideae]|uniref:Small acidic protein-like domain-containing protein n=1 Tax=Apatococcus fuscideae TaxID=2026836 RepID=A0AAW1SWI5_9CHLO